MVIDFHTHIFPDKLAERAIEVLKANCNGSPNFTNGTKDDTCRKMKEWGIDKFVVLNIATNVKQQKKVNDFAIENNSSDCIMFASVHPYAEDALSELSRIHSAGLKGVKLHCEYQGFDLLDRAAMPIYEKLSQLKLPLVLHGGTDVAYQNTPVRCSPKAVKKLKEEFKELTVIMAHLGGYKEYKETLEYLIGRDIYLDTSVADTYFCREEAQSLISLHGEDRLLFGSDCPWTNAGNSVKFIDSLKIPASKKDAILYGNAKFLLKI